MPSVPAAVYTQSLYTKLEHANVFSTNHWHHNTWLNRPGLIVNLLLFLFKKFVEQQLTQHLHSSC